MLLLPRCGFTQPDIPMSLELKSNGESWKVKVRQNGMWGKKPASVDFGPLKTISAESKKNDQGSREVDGELFWKNIHAIKNGETSMKLELNSLDTAMIWMLTAKEETTKEKNVMGTLTNVQGEDEEFYHVYSWVDEMILQFHNDSTVWYYRKTEAGSPFGMLEKIRDTNVRVFLIKVNNLEGKKMKDILLSQPAIGFIFEYEGKQVAAFQSILKQTFWIIKSLDPDLRKAILATAAAMIATIKSDNSNGF